MSEILKNTYPDCRAVLFNEKYHAYTIGGEKYTSVSKVVTHFKPPFDPTGKILIASAKKQCKTPEALNAEWKAKSKRSIDRGTEMHKIIEAHIKQLLFDENTQTQAGSWLEGVINCIKPLTFGAYPAYESVLCEQVVATDLDFAICGTADLLVEVKDAAGENMIVIYDYKTNETFKTEPFKDGETMLGCVGEYGLMNCDEGAYTLQMSIYAYCMRMRGFKVYEKAIIIHIDHDDVVRRIPLTLLTQEQVQQLLTEYRAATTARAAETPSVIARELRFGLPDGFRYNKTDFARLADILNEYTVSGGNVNALDAYVEVSGLLETLELYRDRIKSEAIAEAEKYPVAERKRKGVAVSVRDAGRWAYPKVDALETLKEEVKRVEKLMKSAGENGLQEITDPNSGEILPAATKTTSTTLALTFPKA